MANFIEINGKEERATSHASCCGGSFTSGVAGTNDRNIVVRSMNEGVHVCPLWPGTYADSCCTKEVQLQWFIVPLHGMIVP
jgi:hypothetical protein